MCDCASWFWLFRGRLGSGKGERKMGHESSTLFVGRPGAAEGEARAAAGGADGAGVEPCLVAEGRPQFMPVRRISIRQVCIDSLDPDKSGTVFSGIAVFRRSAGGME